MSGVLEKFVRLNNGATAPALGICIAGAVGERVELLRDVLAKGLRPFLSIQTDSHQGSNEEAVGAALQSSLNNGHILRNDVFVATKLTPKSSIKARANVDEILSRLQLKRIDHLALPSPFLMRNVIRQDGTFNVEEYLSRWQGLESLVKEGKCRSIGVTNLTVAKLQKFLPLCEVQPAMNHIELHPFLAQEKLLQFCHRHHITAAAMAPLGSVTITDPAAKTLKSSDNTTIRRVATDLKLPLHQVMVKWSLAKGHICLPRSNSLDHIAENLAASLSAGDLTVRHLRMLSSLNRHHRLYQEQALASTLGVPTWHHLWDELPVDSNGIPIMGSVLCQLSELPEGSTLGLGFQGNSHSSLFLVRKEGNISAFINKCPHLGISLDNGNGQFLDKDRAALVCATHGALFRPTDGLCTSGPCAGDYLIRIPVHVAGESVIIGS